MGNSIDWFKSYAVNIGNSKKILPLCWLSLAEYSTQYDAYEVTTQLIHLGYGGN